MRYFLDSYALIEIINGNKKFTKYFDEETTTLKGNLAEIYYSVLKEKNNKELADYFFGLFSKIVNELPLHIIPKAMFFRYKNRNKKFSYTDSIGYIFAKEINCRFVTGDKQFKNLENVEFVN